LRESRIKKVWIPNQVEDDIGVVFGDEKVLGSSIKDFEDDSGCDFGDDISLVIQSDCGNPGSISFFNISKKNNIDS